MGRRAQMGTQQKGGGGTGGCPPTRGCSGCQHGRQPLPNPAAAPGGWRRLRGEPGTRRRRWGRPRSCRDCGGEGWEGCGETGGRRRRKGGRGGRDTGGDAGRDAGSDGEGARNAGRDAGGGAGGDGEGCGEGCGRDAGRGGWDGWESCRQVGRVRGTCREPGRMQGESPAPATGPPPRAPPAPQRDALGDRTHNWCQRCSARSSGRCAGAERASGGWGRGRGAEEDESPRPSLHGEGEQVNPAVLLPTKKLLRARRSHLQYILYILL